jgi:hypothetical protein
LPGDGRDRTGARRRLQNDPWGVVNSARKENNLFLKKKSLSHFIHFPIANIATICLQIQIKYKANLGENHSCCSEILHLRHAR